MNDTGLEKGTVSKYLSVLIDLHLIERKVRLPRKILSNRVKEYIYYVIHTFDSGFVLFLTNRNILNKNYMILY